MYNDLEIGDNTSQRVETPRTVRICLLSPKYGWYNIMSSRLGDTLLSGTPTEAAVIQSMAHSVLYYISPLLFVGLYCVVPSPYGKLATPQWDQWLGPTLPARVGWCLFESPNLAWAMVVLRQHIRTTNSQPIHADMVCNYVLYAFFVVHYLRRTLWYPWKMSPRATPTSLGVIASAMAYTVVNG